MHVSSVRTRAKHASSGFHRSSSFPMATSPFTPTELEAMVNDTGVYDGSLGLDTWLDGLIATTGRDPWWKSFSTLLALARALSRREALEAVRIRKRWRIVASWTRWPQCSSQRRGRAGLVLMIVNAMNHLRAGLSHVRSVVTRPKACGRWPETKMAVTSF
jgi:hypothetical protein